MGHDLRSALVSAGLVSQNQAEEAERRAVLQKAEADKRAELESRLRTYPRSRIGKPVVYAEWMLKKQMPVDVERRCAHCGTEGVYPEEAMQAVLDAGWKKGTSLEQFFAVSFTKAQEIGAAGKVLMPFCTDFLPDQVRDFYEGKSLHLCAACFRYHLGRADGNGNGRRRQ
jgi:hypothetical protein